MTDLTDTFQHLINFGEKVIKSAKTSGDRIKTYFQDGIKKVLSNRLFGCREKTIMLVGATGSGKSTLIDGMINYILDVCWEDDVRFSMIDITEEETKKAGDQTKSQTEWITTYTVPITKESNLDYVLNIIDTPGFGDTRGIERDKEIARQVDDLFRKKGQHSIQIIDAVCFVAQSPLARLTPTQKYIFDSILATFGKDITSNIFILITFADGKVPPVLKALEAAEVPFNRHFVFNNSALFESKKQSDGFQNIFWEMGNKSFQKFFSHLKIVEPRSLQLTKEVLKNRSFLEVAIAGLQYQVKQGMSKLENIRKEANVLEDHKSEMARNKAFTYQIIESKIVKIPLEHGKYVTNCLLCNFTCHYPCRIPEDKHKDKCFAMTDGKCKICYKNCKWDKHINAQFTLDVRETLVTKTSDDLKKKYQLATGKVQSQSENLEKVKSAFIELQKTVTNHITEVRKCINELEKIALKPCPLSDIEYIDILINSEKSDAKEGFKRRIKLLKMFREQAEMIQKAKSGNYKPFDDGFDRLMHECDI